MAEEVAEGDEEEGAEDEAEIAWQGEEELFGARGGGGNVEDVDHGGVDDVDAVVEHGDDLEEGELGR